MLFSAIDFSLIFIIRLKVKIELQEHFLRNILHKIRYNFINPRGYEATKFIIKFIQNISHYASAASSLTVYLDTCCYTYSLLMVTPCVEGKMTLDPDFSLLFVMFFFLIILSSAPIYPAVLKHHCRLLNVKQLEKKETC